jgi:Glycosyl hydrolase family 47
MSTGISPEFVQFVKGSDFRIGAGAPHYLLRPETVESFFILNHLTGDPIYRYVLCAVWVTAGLIACRSSLTFCLKRYLCREWGWEVFQSIEKYCKTGVAYGTLKDVSDPNQQPNDKMESFFLAETMKYLYLLFDPDTEIDLLNRHVFNTEAHPIRVFAKIKEEGVRQLG